MTTTADRITRFFHEAQKPILFTGAGVSAITGIPIWGALLGNLAEWLRAKDPLTAQKMIELIAKYDYLRAAQYFFLSDNTTEKQKYSQLLHELLPTKPGAIDELCSLPFGAAVTTNFDRTLFDGIAAKRGISAKDYRRGDNSFRQASFAEGLYVCRLHGFVEDPETIVLTQAHFDELDRDTIYRDYIVNIFTKSNLLLVGFSFSDPAILAVLQSVNKSHGPLAVGNHLALVPEDVAPEVLSKLNRLNIEVHTYARASDDKNHSNLWGAISEASIRLKASPTAAGPNLPTLPAAATPFDTAKLYLASCYARANLGSQIGPLRESIIEGMVSAIVQGSSPKAVSFDTIVARIHTDTKISVKDAELLVTKSLSTLAEEKLCVWHRRADERKVSWSGPASDKSSLEVAIGKLVESTVNRAFVEEGFRSTSDTRKMLTTFFTQLVLQRGWDLGAAFASGRVPKGADIKALMYHSGRTIATFDIELLARVSERMIQSPTGDEAAILAALGRSSFGLELALQAPRSHMLYASTLPTRIYLDANVVMPAFVFGHTYHPIYAETIKSLRKAATEYGGTQICTTQGYLNEIVSHRRLAVDQYESNREFFQSDAIKEAMFSGATNMNVFVGAYANLAAADSKLEFSEFLRKYAPFTNEQELGKWLAERGVYLIKKEQFSGTVTHSDISLQLQKGYASSLKSNKDVRLLEHDAVQLAALARDVENGNRAILVTADRRLREVIANSKINHLAGHMVSHVGLTQLVDLLVGNVSEDRSLAHLLWDATISERSNELRRFFIGLALQHYDEAMAMELPGLVEKFTDDVIREATRRGVKTDARLNGEQKDWFHIAGSFENKFFEAMSEKIEARRAQNG